MENHIRIEHEELLLRYFLNNLLVTPSFYKMIAIVEFRFRKWYPWKRGFNSGSPVPLSTSVRLHVLAISLWKKRRAAKQSKETKRVN